MIQYHPTSMYPSNEQTNHHRIYPRSNPSVWLLSIYGYCKSHICRLIVTESLDEPINLRTTWWFRWWKPMGMGQPAVFIGIGVPTALESIARPSLCSDSLQLQPCQKNFHKPSRTWILESNRPLAFQWWATLRLWVLSFIFFACGCFGVRFLGDGKHRINQRQQNIQNLCYSNVSQLLLEPPVFLWPSCLQCANH